MNADVRPITIVNWNCNGAFRKKYSRISELGADILIIQECEDPAQTEEANYRTWAKNYLWIGQNKHKGLGIFASEATALSQVALAPDGLESFIAADINKELRILAVWTRQANSPTFRYIGQLWKYLQKNIKHFQNRPVAVVGDFNSNACWDLWDRWWNHSDVVKQLENIDIVSVYHQNAREQQGKETIPTFFMHRNLSKPYHIDYAFASRAIANEANLSIGKPDLWLELSDHMPLILNINLNKI